MALTTDHMRKRVIIIMDWCCMCKSDGDSMGHLFLYCEVARDLQSLILCLFGVHWVMLRTILEVLACWIGSFGKKASS